MSCHVAVDIDSDRQPCNVRGHGKHVYSQRGGPAAKALRADAERIDALEQLALKLRVERILIVPARLPQQRLLCQQSRFVKGAAEADADYDRRAFGPACSTASSTNCFTPSRPCDGRSMAMRLMFSLPNPFGATVSFSRSPGTIS